MDEKECKQVTDPAPDTSPQKEATEVNIEMPPVEKTADGIFDAQNQDEIPDNTTVKLEPTVEVIADDTVPVGDEAVQEAVLEAAPARDYEAEWKELADAHPELVGNQMPDDIMQACLSSNLPPIRVYESMMIVKQAEEIKALRNEIATLRQNAEAAAKAPVRATTHGGKTDTEADDAFLRGFNSY